MIDWQSPDTHIQFNPKKYSREEQHRISGLLPQLPAHVWIESSGTTGASKWIALSKEAFLASAQSVNTHLQATLADRWLCAIPTFHVGGLSIFARAHLSGSVVVSVQERGWNASEFVDLVHREKVTLTSLVPTQVYDLVQAGLRASKHIRAIVVGGAALSEELYFAARELGWPVLPSFGMTECCSQIATASLSSLDENIYPWFEILSHVDLRLNAIGCVEVKSAALASMVAFIDVEDEVRVEDPRVAGYWPTRDQVEVVDGKWRFLQRRADVVKIAGEQVSLDQLNAVFKSYAFSEEQILVATPSARWGTQVDLVTTKKQLALLEPVIAQYQQSVLPLERIQNIYFLEELPRTDLGKIKSKEILKQLGY